MYSLDELVTNLRNMVLKHPSFGIKKVYMSEIIINNKMSDSRPLLENCPNAKLRSYRFME